MKLIYIYTPNLFAQVKSVFVYIYIHIYICMYVYMLHKSHSQLATQFCFLYEISIELASVNFLERRSKEDLLKTQLEIQFSKHNIHKTFTKSWHVRKSMVCVCVCVCVCVYTYMYTCVYVCLNRSSKVFLLLNLLPKITMTEMTFENLLRWPNIKSNQINENFSKVSSLLNLLYTLTRELTFKNDFTSGQTQNPHQDDQKDFRPGVEPAVWPQRSGLVFFFHIRPMKSGVGISNSI